MDDGSINRIRLEFKGDAGNQLRTSKGVLIESDWNLKDLNSGRDFIDHHGINRIRLEFKVSAKSSGRNQERVLIESDWNLKLCPPCKNKDVQFVLIESDWNLKEYLLTNVQ